MVDFGYARWLCAAFDLRCVYRLLLVVLRVCFVTVTHLDCLDYVVLRLRFGWLHPVVRLVTFVVGYVGLHGLRLFARTVTLRTHAVTRTVYAHAARVLRWTVGPRCVCRVTLILH